MSDFTSKTFMDFIMRKHFDFCELEQDLSDRWTEDEFNCEYAEAALDIAFDLYPDDQPGEDNDTLMDKRHTFVSEFLEYARNEVVMKWAGNLGMKPSNYMSPETHNLIVREVVKQTKKKCCCCKDESIYDVANYKQPQDSEDEAWEQLKTFQKENFGD